MGDNAYIELGCSKIKITPTIDVPLTGFVFRKGNYEGIHSDLWLKVNFFRYDSDEAIMLICADLIWWDSKFISEWVEEFKQEKRWQKVHFIFHATHTHYAPNIHKKLSPLLGVHNQEYINYVKKQLKIVCVQALDNIEYVSAKYYIGNTSIPINRRYIINNKATMRPNLEGIKDDTLTVVKFITKNEQKIKSVLIHMACHPTTSDDNLVSAEFTSNAAELVSNELYHNPLVSFMQGFSGDTRPPVYKNGFFYRGKLSQESDDLAKIFRNEIIHTLSLKSTNLYFDNKLEYREKTIKLPLNNTIDHKNFVPEDEVQQWWYFYFSNKQKKTFVFSYLSYWKLAKNLDFLFSDGEVVTEYGLYAKKHNNNHLLTCGITNGIVSYIPTKQQILEQGLESYNSIFFFLLPQVYALEVEEKFKLSINKIMNKK